jgi:hypothetical protein
MPGKTLVTFTPDMGKQMHLSIYSTQKVLIFQKNEKIFLSGLRKPRLVEKKTLFAGVRSDLLGP